MHVVVAGVANCYSIRPYIFTTHAKWLNVVIHQPQWFRPVVVVNVAVIRGCFLLLNFQQHGLALLRHGWSFLPCDASQRQDCKQPHQQPSWRQEEWLSFWHGKQGLIGSSIILSIDGNLESHQI
jgi:hypothetical protein